jgi:hypothetical protein
MQRDAILIVCASSVSAKLRDKVKDHAQKKEVAHCDIWSGHEFEERLRRDAEALLRRFIDGEQFPDDPEKIRCFADSRAVSNHSRAAIIILPGSIGAEPRKYNYVEYLIKKLTEFRKAGVSYGHGRGGRVHPGSTRKILERQLGGLPKDLPADRFHEVCSHLQMKINNTALGRNNRKRSVRNYQSFEEHVSSK